MGNGKSKNETIEDLKKTIKSQKVTIRGTVKSVFIGKSAKDKDNDKNYFQIIPKDVINGITVSYGQKAKDIMGVDVSEKSEIKIDSEKINMDLLYQLKLNRTLVHFIIEKRNNEFSLIGLEISDE